MAMTLTKNDIGLDSLAKAMGEAIDNDIADSLFKPIHSVIANATPYPTTIGNSIPLTQQQHQIQGKMMKVEKYITQELYQQVPHDEIKKMLYKDLLDSLIASNCIEYTMVKDPHQRDMVHIRGRIFVTPDDQVRILRVNGVI